MQRRLGRRSRGMGLWSYLWLLLGVGVVLTLTLRLTPHYMSFQTVQSIIDSMDPEALREQSKGQLYETLIRRFKLNSLYDLDPRNIIVIERQKSGTTVRVDYEIRESLIHNADIVLSFQDEVVY